MTKPSTQPAPSPLTLAAAARAQTTKANAPPVMMTGAQALVASLEALGAEVLFSCAPQAPRGDGLHPNGRSASVRGVVLASEQGAGYAAIGYAQATGRVGVCLADSGGGATNLVTAIADAYLDSVPLVAITVQVHRGGVGSDAFQEVDIHGITMPITKHNYQVPGVDDIPRVLAEAFHLAGTGRPGPILVDLPREVLADRTEFAWPPTLDLPGYRPTLQPHGKQIREAARLIAAAARPVCYVGGGVLTAGATEALLRLIELTQSPVVTTLMARGAFPDSHQCHIGVPGRHGSVAAIFALAKADLVVALGTRFDEQVTGPIDTFAPLAQIVHADIDPAEIGKNRAVDVPIVGDARHVIEALVSAVEVEQRGGARADLAPWWSRLDDLRERYRTGWAPSAGLATQQVISRIGTRVGPDGVYVCGVGAHQMVAAQFISLDRPRSWLSSGGLGAMGYAVPAALGAKLGRPEAAVWAIDGDRCFQTTGQELATGVAEGTAVKVAIINSSAGARGPDFVRLAEALGCVSLRCQRPDELDPVIDAAMAVTDRPVVIEFVVDPQPITWPMVAGMSAEDAAYAHELAPGGRDE